MSAAPVFSAASIAGCIFTVLVSIALPVAALAVLKRKTGRGLLAALVGAGCFIGYALVLEQLLQHQRIADETTGAHQRGQQAAACFTLEDGKRRNRQCDGNQHRKNASCNGCG